MEFLKKLANILKKPKRVFRILGNKKLLNWMNDENYLKLLYWAETGNKLNLDNPKTFNEKLQWLKLYDRNKKYNDYVDKYKVRSYVSNKIGEQYLIPLHGVYNSFDEINWDELPDKFVMKCTHGSGSNIICRDKSVLDLIETRNKVNKWMKMNWFWFGREWVYKDLEPRIIFEKFMVDESGNDLKDYKIFCFHGEPKLIEVDIDRHRNHKRNLYTTEWEFIDAQIKHPNSKSNRIKKPEKLDEMLNLARVLSEGIPHVRVDFYSIHDEIYFGEMTFYHGSGFEKFQPKSLELQMGDWLELPEKV